MKGKFIHRPFI